MTDFLLLAFIFLVAGVIAVPLASKFGLGSVLGYLLAGMIISPTLGVLGVDIVGLQHFAEFGVVMMLFLVGLELEPKRLWEMRGRLIGLGGGQVVITILLMMGISMISGWDWRLSLVTGMILSLSSTAIVLQTLNEKGLMKSDGGEGSFSVLLFQDIAVIPMLAFLPLLAMPELVEAAAQAATHGAEGEGHSGDLNLIANLSAWQAGLVTIAAVAMVVFVGNYLTRPIFRFIALAQLRELFTAAALMFVIGIAVLMSLVGLSPALGTFLAGVVLANSEYRHELESDIEPFKGLLLGLFFMTVGAGINIPELIGSFGSIAYWTAILIGTKVAVLWILGRIFGINGADRWLFALGLAQAGEFGFVLLSFVTANNIMPTDIADGLLLVVALSMLITPLLFILYDKVIAPRFDGAQERQADALPEDSHIIVAGRGRFGGIVGRILEGAGHNPTIIDYSSKQLDMLQKFGVKAYFGDATRPDLLHAAGIYDAKLLIIAIDGKDQVNAMVKYASKNYPHLHVIARAFDRNHVHELWALGCRDIIRETYDSSVRMGRSAIQALGTSRDAAQRMVDVFERMDRRSMLSTADVYDIDIPAHENEALHERVKENAEIWETDLRENLAAAREGTLDADSLNLDKYPLPEIVTREFKD
ncbi:MAG: monovalent cation:proton antiporter-2 (CPA2) family protein [Parasphingorhabdus sp.]